jgi:hypothetical protein
VNARASWWAVLGLGLAACGEGTSGPAETADGVGGGLILSEAVSRPNAMATESYVSLPAGSIPGGVTVSMRNRATGASLTAPVVDGAVDPIRLTASTGDTIEASGTDSSGQDRVYWNPVKKRVPPVVVRSESPRSVTDSPTLIRIGVIFSEPIDPRTVTVTSVRLLLRGQEVPGVVGLSADGLRAELEPGDTLAANSTYTLVVTREVRDLTGDALKEEYRTEFTTGPDTGPTIDFAAVSAGFGFTCGVTLEGGVYCWGSGKQGRLGLEGLADHHRPTRVSLPAPAVEVSAGDRAACALTDGGIVYCWGTRRAPPHPGQRVDSLTAVPAAMFGSAPMVHAIVGGDRMCAVEVNQTLRCFGAQVYDSSRTVYVVGPEPGVWLADPSMVVFSVGLIHDCWTNLAGLTFCIGDNQYGQLGFDRGPLADSVQATPVAGGLRFDSLTTGRYHTCGLAGSRAYCWGYNAQGGLGLGSYDEPDRPTPVAGDLPFAAIDAGYLHTCGLTTDGVAYCWGDNRDGTLGDGTRTLQPAPVPIAGGLRFRSITAGPDHGCGITTDGILYCWGANRSGQLGDGSTSDALVPIKAAHQR